MFFLLMIGKKMFLLAPAVEGVLVSARFFEHLKGDKVIAFKRKEEKVLEKDWPPAHDLTKFNWSYWKLER